MSQQNVDLVRAGYDAFACGDYAFMLDRFDPDIEVTEPAGFPDARTYHGPPGVLEAIANWAGGWQDFHQDVERIIDAGDQVVGLVRHHGRGKQSGAPVELRLGYLHTIKNGKIVRWEMFETWDEALEAAGLAHEPSG